MRTENDDPCIVLTASVALGTCCGARRAVDESDIGILR